MIGITCQLNKERNQEMGQDEVLEVLKKNKGWMISGEISSITGVSRVSTSRTLRKLFKQGDVLKREIITIRGKKYVYKYNDKP